MQETKNYFIGKSLWLYIPLWIVFVWLFFQILSFQAEDSHNVILSGLYFVEFGVHEVSHVVASFLPPVFTAAAGSIGEVGFTILIVIAAVKTRSYFAAVFGGIWVMLAMHSVGRYMEDVGTQQLPLVSFGDTAKHDWNFVFSQLGWIRNDTIIGQAVTTLGTIIGAAALVFGVYLIVRMILEKA